VLGTGGSTRRRSIGLVIVLCILGVLAAPAHATFPGGNGKIAFGSDGCVYTINPDGSGRAPAFSCPQNTLGTPEWAPDGRRLAYIDGSLEQVLYVTDGQYPTLIYAGSEPLTMGWSPDGKKVVLDDFTFSQTQSHTELWTQTLAGGQHTTLQSDGPGLYAGEEWSPDGTRIGFFVNGTPYTIKPDGSNLTPIPSFGSWSPDGTKIAFTRNNEIWSMNADGTGQVQLTTGANSGDPTWSPDGWKIAFVRGADIWIMDASGGGEQNVTNSPGVAEGSPSWQPVPINSYPRPKGATPFQTYLTVAYKPCSSGAENRQHGAPLDVPSCSPPAESSDYLTVGTLDANGQAAKAVGSVRLDVKPGNPSTTADEADVKVSVSVKDVRNLSDLSDYAGELLVRTSRQITDKDNIQTKTGFISFVTGSTPVSVATSGPHLLATGDHVAISGVSGAPCANGSWTITVTGNGSFTLDGSSGCGNGNGGTWQQTDLPRGAATTLDAPFSATVPCSGTADSTIGSLCELSTTADAIVPGQVTEEVRSNWELGQILVYDGGADQDADTTNDNTLFMDEGIFVP
jgi:hypothetical protein